MNTATTVKEICIGRYVSTTKTSGVLVLRYAPQYPRWPANTSVPQIAEWIGKLIIDAEEQRNGKCQHHS